MLSKKAKDIAYKVSFDKGMTPKAIVAENGTFVNVNEAYCKLLEYSEGELMRIRFQEITDPADVEIDNYEAERVAKGQIESYEMIKRYITKRKHLVKVLLRVDAVRDEKGNFICFIAQCKKVTDNPSSPLEAPTPFDSLTPVKILMWCHKNASWILLFLTGLVVLIGWFNKYWDKI